MQQVGGRLISSYGPLTEALHRRRLDEGQGQRILAKLIGFHLDEAGYERGQAFVSGVVERAGEAALARLWGSERELPTPAEVDAPGCGWPGSTFPPMTTTEGRSPAEPPGPAARRRNRVRTRPNRYGF